MTRVLGSAEADLDLAADLLREGRLVAVPTETVYGLAAPALDAGAVAKIFEAKERPLFDPLILHLPASWMGSLWSRGIADGEPLGEEGRQRVERLAGAFWPGPLTMVLPKTQRVPDLVTSGLPSVAVRVPRHPVTQRLLERLGFPLAAPSANRFGRISPTRAADVLEELEGRIAAVIDGGPCEIGLESTIVRVTASSIELLRPGSISANELERAGGAPVVEASANDERTPQSPGRLESHYAPRTPLLLVDDGSSMRAGIGEGVALLFFSDASRDEVLSNLDPQYAPTAGRVRVLSPAGDPAEAGRNLFRMLRELDGSGAARIIAEPPPLATGISHAIRDRLRRAASSKRTV